jgi:gamma-glutamylcyclotransferase
VDANYFAYGSNMCLPRLQEYGVTPREPGVPAKLDGYRLVFNKKSEKDSSGKANIERSRGKKVWGVSYRISTDHFKKLANQEHGYKPLPITLRFKDGLEVKAKTFIAINPYDSSICPYSWYKRYLVEGAKDHGLPTKYIASLEAIEAVEDADCKRDPKKPHYCL